MTSKEILAKVKALFAEPLPPVQAAEPVVDPAAAPAPVGVDVTLEDGKVMHCSPDMAAGATATIDGQPAPAADYKLQDGSTVVVGEGGKISEVKAADPVTTEVPPQPTLEERMAKLEEAIAKLSAPVLPTGLATELQLQEATAKIEKQDKVIEGLFELAEKLSETPTAEPQTLTGNKKDQYERTVSKEKRLESIGAAITQLKNKN